MQHGQKTFTVTVATRANASPVVTITYQTRSEAMRAASGLRAGLAPREGGRVTVHDPEGRELQSWIEHPMGAHFTNHGGFQA